MPDPRSRTRLSRHAQGPGEAPEGIEFALSGEAQNPSEQEKCCTAGHTAGHHSDILTEIVSLMSDLLDSVPVKETEPAKQTNLN